MLQIHDIKPLSDVPDYSLYLFILVVVFALLFLALGIYWIYKLFRDNRSIEKEYLESLKTLDFSDPKKAAYIITKYIRVLAKSEREKRLAAELIYLLDDYKYKKNIKSIKNSIKAKLEVFLESVHV